MAIKQLNKELQIYLRKRDKLLKSEWLKLRGHLNNARNEIIQKIQSFGITEWQSSNLKGVLSSIDSTIQKFDTMFKTDLMGAQKKLADNAIIAIGKSAGASNLNIPIPRIISDNIVSSVKPLSLTMAEFFTDDMRKIITGEVSMGMIRGDGVNEVASNIKNKFGMDTKSRDILEIKKSKLEKQYKSKSISETKFKKEISKVNKALDSGSMMSYARAERIAMTEMLRVDSFANQQRALEIKSVNPKAVKIWVNAHLPNARETHLDAEQRYKANPIPVDEDFEVDGEFGAFPRDPRFSAKNSVNCHCTAITINPDLIPEIGGLQVE